MSDLITIVIPAYNVENYIARAIRSVLSQSYCNIELVVVDDGSTDNTWTEIQHCQREDARVRTIQKENGGVTSARLCGASAAKGDWIGFMDGDDFADPDMYERLLNNAIKYHADISHCGYQMCFPNGRIDCYYNTGRLVIQDHDTGLKDLLSGEFVEPGLWNKLYRKGLFDPIIGTGQLDPSIRNMEDLLMNYYLFRKAEKSVFEDFCPYHYVLRCGSAATSKVNEHKLMDPLRVMKIILEDAPVELKEIVLARLTRQRISLATMSNREQKQIIAYIREEARKELRESLKEVLASNMKTKLKIMAAWAAFWPASYGCVHQVYAWVTRSGRKYEV